MTKKKEKLRSWEQISIEEIKEYVNSPEGRKASIEHFEKAQQASERIKKAISLTREQLTQPMTI